MTAEPGRMDPLSLVQMVAEFHRAFVRPPAGFSLHREAVNPTKEDGLTAIGRVVEFGQEANELAIKN